MIAFITNETSWGSLWIPMSMLNVWRIPLLFFVSGMGVYFAMQQRNWKRLIMERTQRILIPFLFGIFAIVPLYICIWQYYYHFKLSYVLAPGHLWFLGNIFIYVVILSPVFFYFKRNNETKFVNGLRKLFSLPPGLITLLPFFVSEAMIVNPFPYELYASTWHGFFLGMFAFFFGYCFVADGYSVLGNDT